MSKEHNAIINQIRKVGHYFKSYSKYKDAVKSYSAHIKACKNESFLKNKKTVVFLINFPESWNSVKSIYEEAQKREDIVTYIVSVPQLSADTGKIDSIGEMRNEAFDFFSEKGIESIKANGKEWFDIKNLNPDYIIYTRPYNLYYPEGYRSYNTCKYAKLVYIPYAYSMLGDGMIFSVLPEDFILSTHRVYLANESRKLECKKVFPNYSKESRNRFNYEGFPRFDLYSEDEYNSGCASYTIAWLPRWTTDDGTSRNKGSHFLLYYKEFLEFAEKNPDITLIIRPHPKMLNHFLAKGIMSQTEIDEFKHRCETSANVEIDQKKDYIDTIKRADLLVADYTSLIAEFFMTGKPIVYCDTAEGLNLEGNKICNSLYKADSFDAITDKVKAIRNGNDEEFGTRQSIIKELLPAGCGNIGKTILDSIINS